MDDTIFACSTGAPPAAIAIVRMSGPAAFPTAAALVGPLPKPRHAALRALRDPRDGTLLDRAVVLVFPRPRSSTGEDLVELHVHGGRAVVSAVTAVLAIHIGVRAAEPGEFTRRALTNGILDLTAAEGLGDLLSAETETQRRAALRTAEGGLRTLIDGWTERLIGVAARVEAQLDFSDEDDVAAEATQAIADEVAIIRNEMAILLDAPSVERLRDGIRIVIAGPPNSGKSTLLNTLTGRDVAIVSSVSGTTRDRIEAPVTRAGIAYVLTDTAGLTTTPGDEIERVGVERAMAAIDGADITLWLDDMPAPDPCHIHVHARADLETRALVPASCDVAISAATGMGIETLWNIIAERAGALLPAVDSLTTNARQRALLSQCTAHLAAAAAHTDMLILAEEVRSALRTFDAITGRSGTEDILDVIFSRFCIGK